jgi:outer membrane protein assembly factor BamB
LPPAFSVLFSGFASVAASASPKFRVSPDNNAQSPFAGPQTNAVKWSFATGGAVDSTPAIDADGTIYFGSGDGYVYALNSDGTTKWSYATGSAVSSSPAIGGDGQVYVGNEGGTLYALDSATGAEIWTKSTGAPTSSIYTSPAISPTNGWVYVGFSAPKEDLTPLGILKALNPYDGSEKWSVDIGESLSSPAVGPDGTIYIGSHSSLLAFSGTDGSLKWGVGTYGTIYSSPAVANGVVYFGSDDKYVYAVNASDGSLIWSFQTVGGGVRSSPAVSTDGSRVIVGSNNGSLYILNADGSLYRSATTGGAIESSPVVGQDGTARTFYVGSNDHSVYAVDDYGVVQWSYLTGNYVKSTPAIAKDGTMYIGSGDGYLYAFGS